MWEYASNICFGCNHQRLKKKETDISLRHFWDNQPLACAEHNNMDKLGEYWWSHPQHQSVNSVPEAPQSLFRAESKADEILTALLAAQNEIWDPVSEIISNLLKEMLKNGSYQIKTGKQSPNGKFQKVWRKINDRLSSWLLLLCHPKSYLAMDSGGEIRTATLPVLVLRFVVLSVCDFVWDWLEE